MKKNYCTLSLIALVLLSFLPCLSADFVHWDDGKHIFMNPLVYAPLNWANLVKIFTQTINQTYIPITTLSYNIEYHIFALKPWAVHLDNMLLHALVTVLIFRLAGELGLKTMAALVASAFFCVHPMHVESVAWATERKDVLSTALYLSALICYLRYQDSKRASIYILSLVFGLLSILAKPMAVSLPWILLLFDYLKGRRFEIKMLLDKIPFAIAIFPLAAITFFKLSPHPHYVFPDSLLIGSWSAAFYLEKFCWPYPLLPLYIPQEPVVLTNPIYLLAVATLAAFLILCWLGRKNRLWVFACLFFAGSIFFFWRFDFADINIVADRFMYLPSLGFCLVFGQWVATGKNNQFRIALAAVVISLMAITTFQQCRIWKNDDSLWQQILKFEPKNTLARKKRLWSLYHTQTTATFDYKNFDALIKPNPNDAGAYVRRGVSLLDNNWPELAMADFQKAISLDPKLTEAYLDRGGLYLSKENLTQALADFDTAIRLQPQDPAGYMNKAMVLAKMHRGNESFELYDHALKLNAHQKETYYQRGMLHRQQSQWNEAVADFTQAIGLDKDYFDAIYARGLSYALIDQWDLAEKDLQECITLDKNNPKPYNELGVVYFKQGKTDAAMAMYDKAISLDPYGDEYFNNRGLLLLKLQRFDEALEDYTQAINDNHEPYLNLITRGDIYLFKGQTSNALKDYTQAIYFSHGDSMARHKRAKLYFDLRQYTKALDDINAILKEHPDDEAALWARTMVEKTAGTNLDN